VNNPRRYSEITICDQERHSPQCESSVAFTFSALHPQLIIRIMNRALALTVAILIGIAAVVIPVSLQPHFEAGSLPDLVCSVILAPGSLLANLILDRHDSAFQLLSRLSTFLIFGGVAYGVLSIRKPTI
jgi:hypothetical protein